jgi:hypothetical protein
LISRSITAGLAERHGERAVRELGREHRVHADVFEVRVERAPQHRLLFGEQEALAVEAAREVALQARDVLFQSEEADRAFAEQMIEGAHADVCANG